MENIPLPSNITFEKGKDENESVVSIWPCFPGYGTTLGNALRRVLLSSLPGAAITSFKVKNAEHEFSAIPNIKEDLVEISLNLKRLRFKMYSEEPQKATLSVKGAKEVKASDIKAPSQIDVISKDLPIATITSKDGELDIEFIIENGRGYVPTENREKEEIEVGHNLIDSIFTPVTSVGFKLENVRVGHMTNYEKLILNIETDGTITPQDALNASTQVLMEQFSFIEKETKGKTVKEKKVTKKATVKKEDKDKKEDK
ncbi:DNA-directed RNA polymerase subunit alpha [Patescibacteria group bacterium]|nr:DNA-directed RNA polymerase subunit alpha [Patescibacteria group bacterium]